MLKSDQGGSQANANANACYKMYKVDKSWLFGGIKILLFLLSLWGVATSHEVSSSANQLTTIRQGPFKTPKTSRSLTTLGQPKAARTIDSGTFGKGSTASAWTIDDAGVLHFGAGTFGAASGTDSTDQKSQQPWMKHANDITSISFDGNVVADPTSPYLFASLPNLKTINNINRLDTSKVSNMRMMFKDDSSLTQLDLTSWDTSKVVLFYDTFANMTSLKTLDLSTWNTSSATTMGSMFVNDSSLTTLKVTPGTAKWNTSKVTTFDYMFYGNQALTSLDVSQWTTTSLTNMEAMFENAASLTNLSFTNWNTSKLLNLKLTFAGCTGLTSLNVGNWNTSNVTNMVQLFQNCTGLSALNIANFDMSKTTAKTNMLTGLGKTLKQLTLGGATNSINNAGLDEPQSNGTTRQWRAVGSGTATLPKGPKAYSSASLMTAFSPNHDAQLAGTYVWFTNQAGITAHDATIQYESSWAPMDNIDTITDSEGNPLPASAVTSVDGTVNPNQQGDYQITYHYVDEVGIDHVATATVTVAAPIFFLNFNPQEWDFGQHEAQRGTYPLEQVDDTTDASRNELQINTQLTHYKLNARYAAFTSADGTKQLTGASLEFHHVALNNTDTGDQDVSGLMDDGSGNVSLASGTNYTNLIDVNNATSTQKGHLVLQLGQQLNDVELNVPQKPQTSYTEPSKPVQYSSWIEWQLTNSI